MNHEPSPVIIEWNRRKQVNQLINLTCILGFLLVALSCRIIYLLYPQQ
jgi:hypothetical protein